MVAGWILFVSVTAAWSILLGQRLLLRALPGDERADFRRAGSATAWETARMAELPGPVGSFVRCVTSEEHELERIDLVCERVAAVDLQTSQICERLIMLARCLLALGGMLSVVAASRAVGAQRVMDVATSLLPIAIHGLVALYCWGLARRAREPVLERRRDWDRLSQVLLEAPVPVLPTSSRIEQSGWPATTDSRTTLNHSVGRRTLRLGDARKHRQMLEDSSLSALVPEYLRLCLA